ncbi:Xaa-Pro peptidase family protein [Nicoliella spurrieriana]|uniref:Xaa-Pro peptidase family protein n=1 Tax=Nicoliella spurrieriana TaxID=2925830 RepID=A0A976X4T8_9LACO|nr:Xaa-Pro peptidase family protein [Nicoliella spurrieriana]UQS86308.1 Xaa-Pro peptidase family protein [Nicoliella spurrieriana]
MDQRMKALRKQMRLLGVNSMVITDAFNLLYLSGFHGLPGDGCFVVTAQRAVLITDSRYETEMVARLANAPIELEITRDYYASAYNELATEPGTVGFENSLQFATYEELKQLFGDRLVAVDNVVEKLRFVKDQNEIMTIKKSCQLADEAYAAMLHYVHAGLKERDVERFLFDWLTSHGASKPSFDTIVVSGYRSALPHGTASDKVIRTGELVTVDFGFYYRDYTFDMTRTFAVGEPGAELRRVYAVVQAAQSKMIQAMHSGADTTSVDAAARQYIAQQGYGDYFGHGSGHGIGLDIHEQPVMGPNRHHQLHAGYVMTAEPGIYLPGKGGVRIEDDVLIKGSGFELLTHSNRDLIVIE